ncbi:MAG: GNAT family protein [Candidatus Thiodiazotropha sp.]
MLFLRKPTKDDEKEIRQCYKRSVSIHQPWTFEPKDYAFTDLNLHRLEANVQPENISSIRLLAKSGFIKEGYSKNYLNVGNQGWRDHERWAIVNEAWPHKHP